MISLWSSDTLLKAASDMSTVIIINAKVNVIKNGDGSFGGKSNGYLK
jgi:hypothetical protein